MMNRLQMLCMSIAMVAIADPALAGQTVQTPAPIAGLGIGAVALIGMGYRAVKNRINR